MAHETKEELKERLAEEAQIRAEKVAEDARLKEEKGEDARLEKLHEEHDRKEGIIEERAEETKVKSLVLSLQRQKYLIDLTEELRVEGIRSAGDLENKLAQANQEVIENQKGLSESTIRRLEVQGIPEKPGSTSTTAFSRQ